MTFCTGIFDQQLPSSREAVMKGTTELGKQREHWSTPTCVSVQITVLQKNKLLAMCIIP